MKLGIRLCTGLALAALPVFSPSAGAQGAKPTFAEGGTVNVCTTAGYPPLTYLKSPGDARPSGIDIDVVDALAKRWNSQARFVTTDFPGLLPALQARRCDLVISGIYINDKRRETYDGVPYFLAKTVIVIPAASKVASPEDLSGQVAAIEAGTSYEKILTELNANLQGAGKAPVTVQTYPSNQAAFEQVLLGRAAATYSEEAEIGFRLPQTRGRLKTAYTYPGGDRYGIYIRRDPKDLAALREAVRALQQGGEMAEIARRHGIPAASFELDPNS